MPTFCPVRSNVQSSAWLTMVAPFGGVGGLIKYKFNKVGEITLPCGTPCLSFLSLNLIFNSQCWVERRYSDLSDILSTITSNRENRLQHGFRSFWQVQCYHQCSVARSFYFIRAARNLGFNSMQSCCGLVWWPKAMLATSTKSDGTMIICLVVFQMGDCTW